MLIPVVRSSAWGLGEDEDKWDVEVPAGSSVADLKAQIELLYEVPRQMQKLSRSNMMDGAAIEDTVKVETLGKAKIYLHPIDSFDVLGGAGGLGAPSSPEEQEAMQEMAAAMMGAVQENMETAMALEESLRGVTYKVHFVRPSDAGGLAAGKKVTLDLDAMAPAELVQQMVEVEMFGKVDAEPAFLVFEGRLLPPDIPIYHAGIENNKVVTVAKERPPPTEEEEAFMAGLMHAAAAAGAGGASGLPMGAHRLALAGEPNASAMGRPD